MSASPLYLITETSCLVNIMHEILVSRWNKGKPCIAVCPSQRLEKLLGCDVVLPSFDKVLALQFKAYRRIKGKVSDYFPIYKKQHLTLQKYPRNCAFYVFPDYQTHTQMDQDRRQEYLGARYKILNNTWFVEVHSIPSSATKVRRHQLTGSFFPSKKWQILDRELDLCNVGLKIEKANDIYVLKDPEERTIETIEIPTGHFSFLYMNIK